MLPRPLLDLADRFAPAGLMLRLRAWRSRSRGDNPELALLPRLSAGGGFIDVGANIGDYTRVAALHYPYVDAFEPIPELAAKLRRELPGHVTIHQLAAADVMGEAVLRIPYNAAGEVTGLASLNHIVGDARAREVTVLTRPLDALALRRPDAIKIDVEGFEEAVLRGAERLINTHRPAMIIEIEDRQHPGRTLDVFRQLWAAGFRAHELQGETLVERGPHSPHWAGVAQDQALVNRRADGSFINNFIFLHPEGNGRALRAW